MKEDGEKLEQADSYEWSHFYGTVASTESEHARKQGYMVDVPFVRDVDHSTPRGADFERSRRSALPDLPTREDQNRWVDLQCPGQHLRALDP